MLREAERSCGGLCLAVFLLKRVGCQEFLSQRLMYDLNFPSISGGISSIIFFISAYRGSSRRLRYGRGSFLLPDTSRLSISVLLKKNFDPVPRTMPTLIVHFSLIVNVKTEGPNRAWTALPEMSSASGATYSDRAWFDQVRRCYVPRCLPIRTGAARAGVHHFAAILVGCPA